MDQRFCIPNYFLTWFAESAFQIEPPSCAVDFSNNLSRSG